MLAFLLKDYYKVLKNYKTENNIFGIAKTIFSLRNEKILILELGTNNPGEIKELSEVARPDIGIFTFIKPVHLKGLKSLNGIFREKFSMVKSNPSMKILLNRDDDYLGRVSSGKRVYWFGQGAGCHLGARWLKAIRCGPTLLLRINLNLPCKAALMVSFTMLWRLCWVQVL
jgi:UDP-N-acetylmuramoyl-tripeptide--D-alanyl-D-alanine ligase